MIKFCPKWSIVLQFIFGLIVGSMVMLLFLNVSPSLDQLTCIAAIASAVAAGASVFVALKNSKLSHEMANRVDEVRSKELMYLVLSSSASFASTIIEINRLFIDWVEALGGNEEPEISFISFKGKLPQDVDWKLFDNKLLEDVLTFEFYLSVQEGRLEEETSTTQEEKISKVLQRLELLVRAAEMANVLMKRIREVVDLPWQHQKHLDEMIENMSNEYSTHVKADTSSREFDS